MGKIKILFNKPIYVGMAVLQLSKELMYNFHYKTMKLRYGDNTKLCYMDTHSFIYIETEDFYKDMKEMINEFDTSDYHKDNIYDIPQVNKKITGKMKDEINRKIMDKFVGLKF